MKDNEIVSKYAEHQGFGPELEWDIADIADQTGFQPEGEVQRRTIYDPNKAWRVRIAGTFQGKPTLLRIENLKLESDEEAIRAAFREQASGSRVRPPHTYLTAPFDAAKGYAFSIDERVDGRILFDPAKHPMFAIANFIPFYRELRHAVTKPFWENAGGDARAFSQTQLAKWLELAETMHPEHTQTMRPMIERLRERIMETLPEKPLQFMHAHLSGWDVRLVETGEQSEYVVFANHFWSWRQASYDIAFPMWGQWMALPMERRTAQDMEAITTAWIGAAYFELRELMDDDDIHPMILNRLYGSLLLDIPAKRSQPGESDESIAALEQAFLAEAERVLAQV